MAAIPEFNRVGTLTWECRDIGYGIESDCMEGYFTGEVDAWGKYTFQPVNGESTIYLFRDEIKAFEPFAVN